MNTLLYRHPYTPRLGDTDAAGVIYFARLLERAHEAYEDFLAGAGLPLQDWLEQGPHLPLVHAEADYHAPLRLGRRLGIELRLADLGRSSFSLEYRFLDADDNLLASARTVHVAMAEGRAVALPPRLRQALRPD